MELPAYSSLDNFAECLFAMFKAAGTTGLHAQVQTRHITKQGEHCIHKYTHNSIQQGISNNNNNNKTVRAEYMHEAGTEHQLTREKSAVTSFFLVHFFHLAAHGLALFIDHKTVVIPATTLPHAVHDAHKINRRK